MQVYSLPHREVRMVPFLPVLTTYAGNLGYPHILVVCEISVALLSSCLPSIFNLVQHAAPQKFSILFARPSTQYSTISARNRQSANPCTVHCLTWQKSRDQCNRASDEQLFHSPGRADYHTTAFATKEAGIHGVKGLKSVFPLNQIHVREEIEVNRLD